MAGTARRKIGPRLINQQTPAWAVRLLNENVAPREGEDGSDGWFGWLFCAGPVPGLPDADSDEGRRLWSNALKPAEKPGRAKTVRRPPGARQKPARRRGAAGP